MDKKYKVVQEKEFKSNVDPNYGDYDEGAGMLIMISKLSNQLTLRNTLGIT
jgi:hypothetical protein